MNKMNIINKVEEIQLMRKSFIEWKTNSSQESKDKFNELKIQLEQAFNNIQKK